ncbi:MAG: hypothetical protein KGJ62_00715 [Armatimonadetes bacterium]|nr:hypothetical protein [Armatimonadota bacterium]MDE2205135.1 hypothetical protein [Armatimonadota bacterium]
MINLRMAGTVDEHKAALAMKKIAGEASVLTGSEAAASTHGLSYQELMAMPD